MDFEKLFSLSGRIGRMDYIIISIVLGILSGILYGVTDYNDPPVWAYIVSLVLSLGIGLPNSFRRLHDTDRSGWWLLIGLIPIVGWIAIFILTWIWPGDAGVNAYGEPNDGTPFPALHGG